MVDLDDWTEDNIEKICQIRKDCKAIIEWFLYYRGSIRQCSEWLGIARSTIHMYIHEYICYYWDDEYQQIQNILKYNSRNRFKPRRLWGRYTR